MTSRRRRHARGSESVLGDACRDLAMRERMMRCAGLEIEMGDGGERVAIRRKSGCDARKCGPRLSTEGTEMYRSSRLREPSSCIRSWPEPVVKERVPEGSVARDKQSSDQFRKFRRARPLLFRARLHSRDDKMSVSERSAAESTESLPGRRTPSALAPRSAAQ